MSYASLKFLLFVLLLLIVYYCFPKKYRWTILLLGSITFYYIFSGKYIAFIILSTLITYISGMLINKYSKKKKLILLLSIFINLGFLVVLKYNNFISSLINPVIGLIKLNIPYKKFILPIGISYYTLDMISYLTDIYRGKFKSERNYFKLLTYFSFFPKIVEGPFCRYDKLSVSLFGENKFEYEKFRSAWVLIAYGFIKKLVIADRLGMFVDTIFENNYGGLYLVIAIIFYTIQIYADFSGCIDIITGISELFKVYLPKNFERPFFSTSIQEFWRRWHMTLGEWLKEYVFYPISLSKMNMKLNLKARKWKNQHLSRFIVIAFPLFFVWFVNGLWHGASLKYVVYGFYYYILMMLGVLLKPVFDKIILKLKINTKSSLFHVFQVIRTIVIVCFGMFIFRCDSFNQIGLLLTKLFTGNKVGFFTLGMTLKDYAALILSVSLIVVIEVITEFKKINLREKLESKNIFVRWTVYLCLIFIVLLLGKYGRGYNAKSFIYGGF